MAEVSLLPSLEMFAPSSFFVPFAFCPRWGYEVSRRALFFLVSSLGCPFCLSSAAECHFLFPVEFFDAPPLGLRIKRVLYCRIADPVFRSFFFFFPRGFFAL